jgi:hypothetical protein
MNRSTTRCRRPLRHLHAGESESTFNVNYNVKSAHPNFMVVDGDGKDGHHCLLRRNGGPVALVPPVLDHKIVEIGRFSLLAIQG